MVELKVSNPPESSLIDDWLLKRYATQACDDPWAIQRYSACRLLKESDISCYLWAEDALRFYGVPTVVFDINIVVRDVREAADALMRKGWHPPPPGFETRANHIREETFYLVEPQCTAVGPFDSVVALTAASDWDVELPDVATQKRRLLKGTTRWPFIPELHQLLDSFIHKWLDIPAVHYFPRGHIGCFLAYLYGYVPVLKLKEFADYLKVEHRQYHFDVTAGVNYTTAPFRLHSRKVRDSIRRGEHHFSDCSVSRNDDRFFTARVEAQLLASLPPPIHTE
ncbi:hypothetical protein PRK78_007474 [Emydomyces testavorans]|uniref:Uncharacterized protein n=1 Tax=Emydomyces testavorans TaxID=2070801 RepID=A0AAF0DNA1_9EURO|nr:hypothetical protein PRK78_007474 [Emydomyces testavorans]